MMGSEEEILLQVLISTYGEQGIRNVAACGHPRVEGVEYLVSWQASDGVDVPSALSRADFRICRADGEGLSKNRNNSMAESSAPYLLVSDDDVTYTAEGLSAVIRAFEDNPGADIITFRYASKTGGKTYPSESFPLSDPPRGYFVSSIEMAFRRASVQGKIWFNENFGIGARFPSGEEDVFIRDCLAAGLNGVFVPEEIARHDAPTTSGRNLMSPSRPYAKGAVFLRIHPFGWPLRMLSHALRELPMWMRHKVPSPFSYCRNWMKGAADAGRAGVFPTPDYSSKYLRHE